jgi:hypothetical protein
MKQKFAHLNWLLGQPEFSFWISDLLPVTPVLTHALDGMAFPPTRVRNGLRKLDNRLLPTHLGQRLSSQTMSCVNR